MSVNPLELRERYIKIDSWINSVNQKIAQINEENSPNNLFAYTDKINEAIRYLDGELNTGKYLKDNLITYDKKEGPINDRYNFNEHLAKINSIINNINNFRINLEKRRY